MVFKPQHLTCVQSKTSAHEQFYNIQEFTFKAFDLLRGGEGEGEGNKTTILIILEQIKSFEHAWNARAQLSEW